MFEDWHDEEMFKRKGLESKWIGLKGQFEGNLKRSFHLLWLSDQWKRFLGRFSTVFSEKIEKQQKAFLKKTVTTFFFFLVNQT